MPDQTPDQLRAHAAEIMLNHARDVERLSIREHLDFRVLDDTRIVDAIQELISTADITIDWPNSPGQTMDVGADDQLATVTRERDEARQDVQSLTDDLSAVRTERDQIDADLAFVREETKSIYDTCKQIERERDTLRAVAQGNKRHVAMLSVLLERVEKLTVSTDGDDLDPDVEIPIGEIRRALNEQIEGTAPVPGSSHARKSPEPTGVRTAVAAQVLGLISRYADACAQSAKSGMPKDHRLAIERREEVRQAIFGLGAEVERLRSVQGWDPSSPQWAVIRAAIAWREAFEGRSESAAQAAEDALVEAVDALPHAGESQASEPTADGSLTWLQGLTARHGEPVVEDMPTSRGWIWGNRGVWICWTGTFGEVRAYQPDRFAQVWLDRQPTAAEVSAVVALAGLYDRPQPKLAQGGIIRSNKLAMVGEQTDGCIVPQEADRG